MVTSHLIDTDVCIDVLRRVPRSQQRMGELGVVAVSSITVMELESGVHRSARPEVNAAALEWFLSFVEVESFGPQAAACAGRIRADLMTRAPRSVPTT